MGRSRRIIDADLTSDLRRYMGDRSWSGADVANALHVHKSTISRALSEGAYSPVLRHRVTALVAESHESDVKTLLRESLRILAISDKLRGDAGAMIARALDLADQNQ